METKKRNLDELDFADESDEETSLTCTYPSASDSTFLWRDGSDDESSSEENDSKISETVNKLPSVLPSVNDLFNSTDSKSTLRFISTKETALSIVKSQIQQNPTDLTNLNAKSDGEEAAVIENNLKSATSKAQNALKGRAKESTAKDRVKHQRLSGQSGIGEDFKSWKSEEEMRQRQMYD